MRHPRTLVGLAFCGALLLAAPALGSPGDLDPAFGGGDGMVINDFGGSEFGRQILSLPNGKIVQAGETDVGGTDDFAIARYKPGGARDNTFGGDGRVSTDFNGGDDGAEAVARYGKSKIVVAGWAESAGGGDWHLAVARYKSGGALDDTFGGDGKVTTPFPHEAYGYDILVLKNGSIMVTGEDWDGSTGVDDFALAKYKPNGQRDTSFSGDGKLTTDFLGGQDGGWRILRHGDSILVGGWGQDGPTPNDYDIALARYRMNGSLDDSFSGDGKRLIKLDTATSDYVVGMLRLKDGRVVIAARATTSDADVGLVRIHPGGGLDPTFGGGDGKAIHDFGGGEFPEGIVRTGERLVVGGDTNEEGEQAVWRFGKKGGVDPSFGTGGEAVSAYPGSSTPQGTDIAKHDGTVLVSGAFEADFAVSRFLLD